MNILNPAIVVVAYNRSKSLERLLCSIASANYVDYSNITLVISIDGGGTGECEQVANSFQWEYGEKRIICHNENLGLKRHIVSCGDLTKQYDSIILLEEDIYVSPYFYDYSVRTASYYQSEEKTV